MWVDKVPSCNDPTCSSCNCAHKAPNTVCYSIIKSWSASLWTSRIVSPMSQRSPSVKVIGSMASFETLTIFLRPNLSAMHSRLSWVEVVPRSTLSFASSISSASYSYKHCLALLSLHCCSFGYLHRCYCFSGLLLLRIYLCHFAGCPNLGCHFFIVPFLGQLGDVQFGITLPFLFCRLFQLHKIWVAPLRRPCL